MSFQYIRYNTHNKIILLICNRIYFTCVNIFFFFFLETLRMYPVLQWLSREAMETYTFTGTKVTISKGQQVFLPVYAIQRDPDIYPNPDNFDPERFTDDKIKTRHSMALLPFGDGPRHCSGKTCSSIKILIFNEYIKNIEI